jgi:hypothetical protein
VILIVLEVTDQAIIADAIPPESSLVTAERLVRLNMEPGSAAGGPAS